MILIRRFSSSLFSPKEVISYHKDPWYIPFFYFLLISLISVIPYSITTIMQDEIPYESKQEIRSLFNGSEIPFIIENNMLVSKGDKKLVTKEFGQFSFVFSVNEDINSEIISNKTIIAFQSDGLYLIQSVANIKIFEYQKYAKELNNLDLGRASDYSDVEFWDTIFSIANKEYRDMKPTLNTTSIAILFVGNAFTLISMAVLLGFFQSLNLSRIMKFSKLLKLCIYLLTPYAIGGMLTSLFNLEIFSYIGLILSAFYIMNLGRNILKSSIGGN